MKRALLIGLPLLLMASVASAQDRERPDESVVLISLAYDHGGWRARAVGVLPCPGPSKPDAVGPSSSMFQIRNRDGRVLFRRYIMNPRIILVEDPREPAAMLRQMRFTLPIPIRHEGERGIQFRDVHTFEFFERANDYRQGTRPSVALRVDTALEQLTRTLDTGRPASCELRVPSTERMPPLGLDPGTGISLESLASMIQRDRGALFRWGLEHNVTPDELRAMIRENPVGLAQANLTPERAEALVREYEVAYRRQRQP